MLGCANDLPSDLFPIDAIVQLFIDQADYGDVVASDQIQAMLDLRTRLWVVGWSDDSFDGFVQDNVGHLVAGE